jgi:N-methylhydantoinase A
VTDANLALGRLPASAVLGGSLGIDRAAAEAVLASLGSELDIASGDLAAGIVAIADAAMANAIRELTVFRGIDPRSFALMAFGGAGPLHAVALAEELDIGTVIVPLHPGALSAWGMLHADFRLDRSVALTGQLGQLVDDDVHAATATLERALGQVFATGFFELTSSIVNYSADLRYVGQEYTLTIGLDEIEKSWQEHLRKRFDDAYQIRFGHSNRDEEVEIVNLRATLVSPTAPIPHRSTDAVGADPVVDRVESWADGWTDTPVLDRRLLASGGQHAGPAIVLEEGCTTYIPPDWTAFVHADGHLLLTRSES